MKVTSVVVHTRRNARYVRVEQVRPVSQGGFYPTRINQVQAVVVFHKIAVGRQFITRADGQWAKRSQLKPDGFGGITGSCHGAGNEGELESSVHNRIAAPAGHRG